MQAATQLSTSCIIAHEWDVHKIDTDALPPSHQYSILTSLQMCTVIPLQQQIDIQIAPHLAAMKAAPLLNTHASAC